MGFEIIKLLDLFLGAAGGRGLLMVRGARENVKMINSGSIVLFLYVSLLLFDILLEFLDFLGRDPLLLFNFANCFLIT